MKTNLLILALTLVCAVSASTMDARIAPYLKLARGGMSAIGALYFGSHAYSWHKKAEASEPNSSMATYAQGRSYISAIAALFLGISAFMAIEKSLEQLDK